MNLFDLLATISLDVDGYEKGIDDVESGADYASRALESINTDSAERGLDDVGDAADNAGSDLDGLGNDADSAGSDLDDLGADADSAGADLDSLGSDATSAGSDLDDLASSADDAADSISGLGDAADGSLDGLGDLGSSLGGTVVSGSNDAAGAVSAVTDVLEAFQSGGIVAGVTAGVSAIATGIYKMGTETQDAAATIAQGTGATGDALDEMTKRAESALNGVKQSSDTNLNAVAETLAEVNTRFGYTGDVLEDTTVLMEDYAAVTGQTGAQATDAIADAMAKWNLEAENMPGLLDQITVASQSSGASATDLESALSNNSAAFQELGMSTEDALAFMSAYVQSGGDCSDMSGILKAAVSSLNGEVDDVPAAFQDAITAIQESDDAASALNAEVGDTGMTVEDVFGTKMANKVISACQSSQFSLEDMEEALSNCDGAMEATADASVTFNDKVQGAFNKVKSGCRTACSKIKEFFTGTKDSGEECGDGLVEGLENSASGVEAAGEDVGQAVIDGVNDTLETHSPSKVMVNTGEDVTTGLSNGMKDMPEKVGGILSNVTSKLTSFGKDTKSSASDTGSGFVSNIKSGLGKLTDTVTKPLQTTLNTVTSWGKDSTSTASSTAKDFVSNVNSGLSGTDSSVSTQLNKATNQVNSWKDMMKTKSESIGKIFVNYLISGMSDISGRVSTQLSKVTEKCNSWNTTMTNNFTTIGKNIVQGLINGINNKSSSLYSTITNVVNNAISKANKAAGTHSPSTKTAWTGEMLDRGFAEGLERYSGVAEGAMENVVDDMMDAAEMEDLTLGSMGVEAGSGSFADQMAAFSDGLDKLFNILDQYLPDIANMQVVMDTGATVAALAPKMDVALGKRAAKGARMG